MYVHQLVYYEITQICTVQQQEWLLRNICGYFGTGKFYTPVPVAARSNG